MAWSRAGDKPLSKPMMGSLLTHICVTRPIWINVFYNFRPVTTILSSWRHVLVDNIIVPQIYDYQLSNSWKIAVWCWLLSPICLQVSDPSTSQQTASTQVDLLRLQSNLCKNLLNLSSETLSLIFQVPYWQARWQNKSFRISQGILYQDLQPMIVAKNGASILDPI